MKDRNEVPIDERRFTLLPPEQRSGTVRSLSARLNVGRWAEHRKAADFITTVMEVHGEGIDTIVRALLLYEEYLALRGGEVHPETEDHQLILSAGLKAGATKGS